MQACDFSRSFVTFRIDHHQKPSITGSHQSLVTLNNARIALDCICDLTPPNGSTTLRYVLGASCKTERVGVDSEIWTEPNADFAPIFSQQRFLIIKRWDTADKSVMLYPSLLGPQPQRQMGTNADAFDSVKITVVSAPARILETTSEVLDAGLNDQPLVARTEFETNDSWHVVLEYPVKTINLDEREMLYQPDTGPVIWPQNPGSLEDPEAGFQLAFVAFHQADWAEFLINVLTSVSDDVSVHHYSQPQRVVCSNVMSRR